MGKILNGVTFLKTKNFSEFFPKLSLIQIESQKTKEEEKNLWITRLTVSLPSGEYLEEKKKLQEILRLLKDIRKIVKFKRYNFA